MISCSSTWISFTMNGKEKVKLYSLKEYDKLIFLAR